MTLAEKIHEKAMRKLATFVHYANGKRETLAGFEEQQEICLNLKAKMREAKGIKQ